MQYTVSQEFAFTAACVDAPHLSNGCCRQKFFFQVESLIDGCIAQRREKKTNICCCFLSVELEPVDLRAVRAVWKQQKQFLPCITAAPLTLLTPCVASFTSRITCVARRYLFTKGSERL